MLQSLDDEGELASTLEQYKQDHLQRGLQRDPTDGADCETCGGRRFVVCSECNGSRKGKTQVFGKYLKCSFCNENGLQPCPSCNLLEHAERERTDKRDTSGGAEIVTVAKGREGHPW